MTSTDPQPAPAHPFVLTRRTTFWLLCSGAALIALMGLPGWIAADGSSVLGLLVPITISGSQAVTVLTAVALLHGAGAVASLLAGPWARRCILLLCAAGVGLVWYTTITVVTNPDPFVARAATDATGISEATATQILLWPYLTIFVAALYAIAEVIAVFLPAQARKPSKYDRGGAATSTREPRSDKPPAAAQWDAFDQGVDPTST